MLLNRVLTVRPGAPASHRGRGWEAVTDAAIAALVARGRAARRGALGPRRADPRAGPRWHADRDERAPEPAVRAHGFFGSRPFSRVDELLAAQGAGPVDWSLP